MTNNAVFDQNFINLSTLTTPADVLFKIGNIIENNNLKNKKVKLNLGDISFSHAHIYGLKSILESSGIEIEGIYTTSQNTQFVAQNVGITVLENLNTEPTSENTDEAVNKEQNTEQRAILEEITNSSDTEKALEEAIDNVLNIEDEKKVLILQSSTKNTNTYETLYVKQTLRSGQSIGFDGNVLVIGDCHPGSEITASGDITVWGLLSGIAHAGSKGNNKALIRAFKINAIQLRIANNFARKPDRLMLDKNEKTASFTPEEARISDGEIKIYS